MKEQTKFQEFWSDTIENLLYFMFGWLFEMEPPEWRLILLPIGIVTSIIGFVPLLIFSVLDILINGEFYN